MSDIRQITHWRTPTKIGAVYDRLLAAIGTNEFGATVRDAVLTLTSGARRLYLFEATDRVSNDLQYSFCEPEVVELFPAYRKWYLQQDPVGDAFAAAPQHGDVALQRIRPSDIASPVFRRRFFDDLGVVERVSIVQRGADAWRVINIARHSSDGRCSDRELHSLLGLACLALPMLPLNRRHNAVHRAPTVAELERRFADRCAELTAREREVCARAARGMSVEATALALGVAKTSVLTYRQRAYQRLGVASAHELAALVAH